MDPTEINIEELAKLFAFVADDQDLSEWHCHYFIQQAFRLVHELHIKELHRRLDDLGERLKRSGRVAETKRM
jgi:hypothetical protein